MAPTQPEDEENYTQQEEQESGAPARRRGRSSSVSRPRRRGRNRSRTRSSEMSSARATSLSEGDSTETDGSERGRQKRKKKNRNLYEVLKTHEKLLKQLASEVKSIRSGDRAPTDSSDGVRVDDIANSLSRTTLKQALQEERGKDRQPESNYLEVPKLNSTDCKEQFYNKAIAAFHSSFRSMVTGKDGHSVRELYQLVSASAEANGFSKRQFYAMMRSRVAHDSPLGEYVRESIRKNTSLRNFSRGLAVYFGRDDNYLSALRKYQEFNGRNLSAKEFLVQLRSVSSGLVENQPGGPKDPHTDEQTLLCHMREKFFMILPTLAETILNKERTTRAPTDTFEFGELLDRYRLSIEANLRGRKSQVNDLSVELTDGNAPKGSQNDLEPPLLSENPASLSVNSVQEKNRSEGRPKPKVLQLTSQQLAALRDVCYKCKSLSPIQDKDHRSATCLLYKGKALASYVCSKCKLGVHLPSDCLQAEDRANELKERAAELNLPIRLGQESITVNIIEESFSKNA